MTAIIIIGILVFIIYASQKNNSEQKENKSNRKVQLENAEKYDKAINTFRHSKVSVKITYDTSNGKENTNVQSNNNSFSIDDSIIDVTNLNSVSLPAPESLEPYPGEVPYWKHQYVYSYNEINAADAEQKEFYKQFSEAFAKGIYYDTQGFTNYQFILLFQLLAQYEQHRDLNRLELELRILGRLYSRTQSYAFNFLIQKMQEARDYNGAARIQKEQYSRNYSYVNDSYLGNRYKSQLQLSEKEKELLNKIFSPSNNFFNIPFCGLGVVKLFVELLRALDTKSKEVGSSLENTLDEVADFVARKQYRTRKGSDYYKYYVNLSVTDFCNILLRYCENEMRERLQHKRKITAGHSYTGEIKTIFEDKILTPALNVLPSLLTNMEQPDLRTETELNAMNTSRWKFKFEKLSEFYQSNPDSWVNQIVELGNENKKNPSVENIFFEGSKFIARHDATASLTLYIHYIFHDLHSATFDNKQLTKTIQKGLFKTNEQLQEFENIVSALISDKNLDKALKAVPSIYEPRRKKIKLDAKQIKDVQQQHSGTVELLNEYLQDEEDTEKTHVTTKQVGEDQLQISIIANSEIIVTHESSYLPSLQFNVIQAGLLDRFTKGSFTLTDSEVESYAKVNGVFKNQLVDSINEITFEVLDDLLIETEDDLFTITEEYYNIISKK